MRSASPLWRESGQKNEHEQRQPGSESAQQRSGRRLGEGIELLTARDGDLTQATKVEAAVRRRAQRDDRALVQQVISKLPEVSFDTCIAKPDSALSAGERACIHTMVGKYLDTSEFVMGRAAKKQQAQQAQQFG